MLRLILGRAGTGKTGHIIGEIRERAARGEGKNILVVPEQYSHEAERELLRACGDSASLYAEVLSFTRLAHAVARERGGSARTYADAGQRALEMALALDRAEGALAVYGGARRQPEAAGQLLAALDELRSGGADGAALLAAAERAGGRLGAKLRDLALLRDALAAVEERSGADPLSRLELLAQEIGQSELLRGGQVYIDGFTDFTAQERRVVRELWLVGDVTVCLSCDSLHDETEVFALPRRTAHALRRAANADGVAVQVLTVPSRRGGTAMGFLEENLFRYTGESFDAHGAVRLRTAHSAAAECELAAAEALRLVRETGCRWRDIAVAVRGFSEYRGALESIFERYGVPLYVSARADILAKPLPALVNGAFAILSGGWSYEDVFAYLKTGLAGLTRAECDELENYVLLWELRGGAWTGEQPWRQHPDGYGLAFDAGAEERLGRLNALRERVAGPLRRLSERGRAAGDARGQCEATAAFWEELELPARLDARAAELRGAGREQDAAETAQLWEKTVTALEQCAAVLGDMPLSQDEFARLFRLVLSEYDVGTIPVAVDRVTAGDFDRMRRRNIRHLLILGADDGRLPSLAPDSGVFTAPEREALRELDVEVEDEDSRLDREFSLIYHVLALPSETLWLSRPLYAADGGETRPSFVTERVSKLFGTAEEPGDLTQARAASPRTAFELAAGGSAEALSWFAASPEAADALARLRGAAELARGRLGPDGVRALYGERTRFTASRIDTFASCHFQYFLRYGLRAKPRESAGFHPPERGTFLHFVLERVARRAAERGGFAALSDGEVEALADAAVQEYVHTTLEDFREKSVRFVYLFRRLTTTVHRVVLDTAAELRRSDFTPLNFELDFSDHGELPPVTLGTDASLELTGVADRVDGWEKDGRLYLRVVDYKTGVKSFSLSDVWYGMGLQMLLYLFALSQTGEERYQKEIVPAGVLYVPARDVLLSAPSRLSDEEIVREKAKKLRRSGLVLSDESVLNAMEHGEDGYLYLPVKVNRDGSLAGDALATAEQLGQLSQYVEKLLGDMAGELRRGSIAADPWCQSESESTCLWCKYYDACRFDEAADEPRYRAHLTAPEFWGRLNEGRDGTCR